MIACDSVYKALQPSYGKMIETIRGDYNPAEIKHIIGLCDFFVGARMHACIASLSQGVPSVPIAYSDKFLGVMETIGCGSIVADARVHDADELLEQVEKIYDARQSLRSNLERDMPRVIRSTVGLFDKSDPVHPDTRIEAYISQPVSVG